MINYLKSENYRVLRKKTIYVTTMACFFLIIAAAIVLYISGEKDADFPYVTSLFFYSNVVSGGVLILIVALLFNQSLTGKDLSLLKQSVSFGISRNTIFWSKLLLTLSYFLLICVIGLLLMVGLGENFFANDEQSTRSFIIASINMLPVILSGFFMIHVMKMLRFGDVYVIIIVLFVFTFSGTVFRVLFRPISGLNELYKYTPSELLNENLINFMAQTVQLDFRFWVAGIFIALVILPIGVRKFAKQNID